jgi:hypothetical protein
MAELRIGTREFAAAAESVLPRFERVITGSSVRPENCCQFAAFGYSERLLLYVESTNWGEVSAAGLVLDLNEPAESDVAGRLLATLETHWPLMLVDWGWREMLRLSDRSEIRRYLRERLRFFEDESQAS